MSGRHSCIFFRLPICLYFPSFPHFDQQVFVQPCWFPASSSQQGKTLKLVCWTLPLSQIFSTSSERRTTQRNKPNRSLISVRSNVILLNEHISLLHEKAILPQLLCFGFYNAELHSHGAHFSFLLAKELKQIFCKLLLYPGPQTSC